MRQITDRVYTFSGLLVGRVYLIKDSDGLTIIDAGLKLAAPRILRQLQRAGFQPSDVKRILITHAHPDHVGALPELKAATGAQVIASAYERPFVEGKRPVVPPQRHQVPPLARMMIPKEAKALPGTPVDRVVSDGEILHEIFDGLQAVATPGHSPGHMSYWQPQRRILFTGDVVLRLPRLRLPFAAFTTDMAQNKRSLKRVANLDPAILCFGHGTPIVQDAGHQLKRWTDKVTSR